jgi:hypothetical protein
VLPLGVVVKKSSDEIRRGYLNEDFFFFFLRILCSEEINIATQRIFIYL